MTNFIVTPLQLGIGIFGIVGTVLLIVILFIFGRLIKHKMRISLLAKRGYNQIRHIKEDMTEKYYFLRIRDDHYSFADGVHLDQPDTKTKTSSMLAPLNYNLLLKKENNKSLSAEEGEILKFLKSIKESKVMDINTLSWGIPTITYFGNNPNPVNYKDIKKVYDAKNIAAMIKRILMTKEWKLVRMVLILCVIAIGLWIVLGFLDYSLLQKNSSNLANCLGQLNVTYVKYTQLLNSTGHLVANTTVVI